MLVVSGTRVVVWGLGVGFTSGIGRKALGSKL